MGKTAPAVVLEVRTERDRAANLRTGEAHDVLRVLYRPTGARRWTRVLAVPDERQTVDELEAHAAEIAELHYNALHHG